MQNIAGIGLTTPKVPGNLRPEFNHPAPDTFVRYVDAAFQKKLLNLAQAQVEACLQPDRMSDNL